MSGLCGSASEFVMRFQSGFWLGLHSSESLIGTGEAAFKASATFLIIIPYILKILKNHFGLSIFLILQVPVSSFRSWRFHSCPLFLESIGMKESIRGDMSGNIQVVGQW